MTDDKAMQRAAGFIMWKLVRGVSEEEAVAGAQFREPDLTDSDMRNALAWAKAAIAFGEMANNAPPDMTIAELFNRSGLPL